MSDSPRTSQAIVAEYNNLAFKAGNIQYQINEQKRDLNTLNETMRTLNLEFAQVKAQEDEAAKKTTAEAPVTDAQS